MKLRCSFTYYLVLVPLLICTQVTLVQAENEALRLVQVYTFALEHDAEYNAALHRFQSEAMLVPQARASLLPRVTIEAKATLADYENDFGTLEDDEGDEGDVSSNNTAAGEQDDSTTSESGVSSHNYGLYVRQPLYQKDLWERYSKAKKQVLAAELRLEAERQRLALEVSELYFEIIRLNRDIYLANAEIESYRLRWQQAESSLAVGFASRADMLEAKARLDQTKARLLVVDRDLHSALRKLQRRIGRSLVPEDFPVLNEDSYYQRQWDAEEWLQRTMENNVALLLARMEEEIVQGELDIQKAAYYPKVTLTASISDSYNEDPGFTQGEDMRASVVLEVPLFEGGYTYSSVKQAASGLKQAKENVRNALESATVEIHDILDGLETGKSNILAWQQIVNARISSLNAVAESNKQGLQDMVAVLDAQTRLNLSRRELNNIVFQQLQQQVRLYATAGVLFEQDLQRVDSHLQPASL